MASSFNEITFGIAAAEAERASNPNLLIEGFFDSCGYMDNLVYVNKFLVLGPKAQVNPHCIETRARCAK